MAASQTVELNVEYQVSAEKWVSLIREITKDLENERASGSLDLEKLPDHHNQLVLDLRRAGIVSLDGEGVVTNSRLEGIAVSLEQTPDDLALQKILPILKQTISPVFNPFKLALTSLDPNDFEIFSIKKYDSSAGHDKYDLKVNSDSGFSVVCYNKYIADHIIDGQPQGESYEVSFKSRFDYDLDSGVKVTAICVVPKEKEVAYASGLKRKLSSKLVVFTLEPDSVRVYNAAANQLKVSLDDYAQEASFRRKYVGAGAGLISKLKTLLEGNLSWQTLRDRVLTIMAEEIEAGEDPFNTRTHASNRVLLDLLLLADQEAEKAETEQTGGINLKQKGGESFVVGSSVVEAEPQSETAGLKKYLLSMVRGNSPKKPEASNNNICAFYEKLEWKDGKNTSAELVEHGTDDLLPSRRHNVENLIQMRKKVISNSGGCAQAFGNMKARLLRDLKKRHWGITWFFSFLPTIGKGENALKIALEKVQSSHVDNTKALVQILNVLQDRLTNSTSEKYGYYAGVLKTLSANPTLAPPETIAQPPADKLLDA